MSDKLNLINKRFGKWIVVDLDHSSKNGQTYWNCLCDCGNTSVVRGTTLISNKSSKCGTCAKSENGKKNRKEDSIVAVNNLFRNYKNNAKRRDYKFNLSKEEFYQLTSQDCFYCGIRPSNVFTGFARKNEAEHSPFMYSGIDRVDNTQGYHKGNCVPCCATCNYAKSNMQQEQFLDWIKSVYMHRLSGIQQKTLGMLTDELGTTLIKCFMAQEDIMNPELDTVKQKDAAVRAQELNARRNKLIRAIDEIFGFVDNSHTAKTYYTYFSEEK